ncbi:MAG: HAD-IA family hydrolase [Spirochaetales bacterium]|nr:HAD-IA family hydrolase [Spirochaetales bacterium]
MTKQHNNCIPEYDTYLFDADGTLWDSADLIVASHQYTVRTFGDRRMGENEVTAHHIKKMMGLPLRYQMELYFGPLSDDEYEEIYAVFRKHQEQIYRDYLKLFPGVAETLAALKKAGKKIAIVTSRKMQSLRCYTNELGIDSYFDTFITPGETQKHKPDAEPVLEALRQLASAPERTVFIGDALYDIQSGSSAGVDTVFVNWSYTRAADLETQPDYCIDRMNELTGFRSARRL